VDLDPLTWTIVTQPSHGVLSGTGAAKTYTPALNYNGPDSFTFRVNDGTVNSNTATVSITVTAVNDAPVANVQSVSTNEDTAKAITLVATDVENNPLTWAIVAQPAHGALSGTAPALTYTPAANYTGADSFTFMANDGLADSNIATVTITVTPVNDPPAAVNDSFSTLKNKALSVPAAGVLINDTDLESNPLTAVLAVGPAHGVLTLNADGSFIYTPDLNYAGADSFTYRANDGLLNSANIATVSITIDNLLTTYLPVINNHP
jgi:VCBS repeat-containing protein